MYSILKRLKKDVFLYNYDPTPSFLKFLPYSEKIVVTQKVDKKFDVGVFLECSEISRFGNMIDVKKNIKTAINIDHHLFQQEWADINWFDSTSSSVSEMIYYVFKYLKMSLTKEEATLLYTGIVTDTYNFRHANTTSQSHIITSELLKYGVETNIINKHIYGTKTLNALHLLGIVLTKIKMSRSNRIAYTTITEDDLNKTKTTIEDTEEIINYAGMIPNVQVWLLFKEMHKQNLVKVSFRSAKEIDVNKISNKFGGGGHKNASGCTINGNLDKVIDIVIGYVESELNH